MIRKECSKCENYKPLREFNRYKDGYQSYCRTCQEEYRLLNKYNISREHLDALYRQQDGKCRICERAYDNLKTYFCDSIGIISLLCYDCMYILNRFQRDPLILQAAISYLTYFIHSELPPCSALIENCEESQGEMMSFIERKYGITQETYDYWSTLSQHTCYICREKCKTGKSLAVDHSHEDEKIRGLLCCCCNTALGFADENIDLLDACISYLESYIVLYLAYYIPITDNIVSETYLAEEACMRECDYLLQKTMI